MPACAPAGHAGCVWPTAGCAAAEDNLGANNTITIAPKRGEGVTGKLGSGKEGIDGFVALGEKGRFFVDRKHVVSITFLQGR